MAFIKPLPSWVLVNRFPAFYDSDSLTATEQTARVYAKVQELVDSYNKYVEQINSELMELDSETDKELNCVIKSIMNLTSDYIATVDLKLAHMDRKLDENYLAFTDHVLQTISDMIVQLKESGELDQAILLAVGDLETQFTNISAEWDSMKTAITASMTSLRADYENTKTAMQTEYSQYKGDMLLDFEYYSNQLKTQEQAFFDQMSADYGAPLSALVADASESGKLLYEYETAIQRTEAPGISWSTVLDYRTILIEFNNGVYVQCYVHEDTDGERYIAGVGTTWNETCRYDITDGASTDWYTVNSPFIFTARFRLSTVGTIITANWGGVGFTINIDGNGEVKANIFDRAIKRVYGLEKSYFGVG